MPRAKADNVVIHRIELGGKERELAEGALAAFQFNRVAGPVVAALSDVSFLVFAGGILAAYKFIDEDEWAALSGGLETNVTTAAEVMSWGEKAYKTAQRKYREAGQLYGEVTDPSNILSTIWNFSPFGATWNAATWNAAGWVADEVVN